MSASCSLVLAQLTLTRFVFLVSEPLPANVASANFQIGSQFGSSVFDGMIGKFRKPAESSC